MTSGGPVDRVQLILETVDYDWNNDDSWCGRINSAIIPVHDVVCSTFHHRREIVK